MFDTFGQPDCINCYQLLVLAGVFRDSSAATIGISLKREEQCPPIVSMPNRR